jgi:opine dehydrogenase
VTHTPRQTIAVLGAGNLGLAQAGHLAVLGHGVRLYNRSPERLGPLASGAKLRLRGAIEGEIALELASTDLAAVVRGADLIFVDVPGNGHGELAVALGAVLKPESRAILLLHPGQTLGSRHFARALGLERFPGLALGELQTALYTTRSAALAETTILALKQSVALAAYPSRDLERLSVVRRLYPQLVPAQSTLHTALTNVQAFIHPAVCLLNLARIERGESFTLYRDGLTAAVGACFDQCDAERLELAAALGLEVPTAAEWFNQCYGVRADTALEAMLHIEAYEHMAAPADLRTRLLWEDVPTGLVPLVDLMRLLDLPSPTLSGLLALCVAALGPRVGEGWTLVSLGLTRADDLVAAF